jgi:hypothetical protein
MPSSLCSDPDGAKLVATKAKGLPRIAISLHRVTGAAVSDVVAEISLALYAAYKTTLERASRGCCHSMFLFMLSCLFGT